MNLLSALLLGLADSLHCVGMCGPLLLALPLDAAARRHVWGTLLCYHAGRIGCYGLLGLLFGLLGHGLALAGLQKGLSLTAGFFLLALVLPAGRFERRIKVLPGFGAFSGRVKTGIGRLLQRPSGTATFTIGLLNGLLPCGMVYAALAGAIASTSGAAGALFMTAFGLGTLPLLLLMGWLGRSFGMQVRQRIRLVQPLLLIIAALLLLQRGLHLDISLFESAVPKAGLDCH